MSENPLTIGVLALQGAFEAHAKALTALGATAKLVRTPAELRNLDGLIVPGGESTTFLKFLERDGFLDALQSFVETTPTFGTCAGAILLAKNVENPTQTSLAALDITVERNAYGRQIDSTILTAPTEFPAAHSRWSSSAPPASPVPAPQVETLATRDGFPVLVREGHLLAATFHPELSADPRVHQLFLDLIRKRA